MGWHLNWGLQDNKEPPMRWWGWSVPSRCGISRPWGGTGQVCPANKTKAQPIGAQGWGMGSEPWVAMVGRRGESTTQVGPLGQRIWILYQAKGETTALLFALCQSDSLASWPSPWICCHVGLQTQDSPPARSSEPRAQVGQFLLTLTHRTASQKFICPLQRCN